MDEKYAIAMDLLGALYGNSPNIDGAIQDIKPGNDTPLIANTEPLKETLPSVELTLPTYFAGKIFLNTRGATDHVAHPSLEHYYSQHIANSRWAADHLYGNTAASIKLRPAKFDDLRYRIFGVQANSTQISAFNVECQTEGDMAIERGVEPNTARNFCSTELRTIQIPKAVDLLSRGYDLWSTLADTRNLIWVNYTPHKTYNRNIVCSSFREPATEILTIQNGHNSLWDNDQWLLDDSLVASLANTYLAIQKGKHVIMPKSDHIDNSVSILIGQAISQMYASKMGTLIGFVTDRGILGYSESNPHNLTFTDEKRPSYLQTHDVFIDPNKGIIADSNREMVKILRESFTKPLHIALEEFRNHPTT